MIKEAIKDFFKKVDYLLTAGITVAFLAFVAFFAWRHAPEDSIIIPYPVFYIISICIYVAFLILYSILSVYYRLKTSEKINVTYELTQKVRKVLSKEEVGELTLIVNKSSIFKINMLVSIYYDEGKSDSCEKFLGIGKIKNINDKGFLFVAFEKPKLLETEKEEFIEKNYSKIKIKATIMCINEEV